MNKIDLTDISLMQQPTRTEILVVDSMVPDYQTLIDEAKQGIEVILIDSADGIKQLAALLEGRSGIDALHIVSHGKTGVVNLGSVSLSNSNIDYYSEQLSAIGSALTESGDILFYGCNVASGVTGDAFTQKLSSLTGADIAASEDLTGPASLGGDWELESVIGHVEAEGILTQESGDTYGATLALPATTQNFSDAYYNNNTGGNTNDGFTITLNGGAPKQPSVSSIYFGNATLQDGSFNFFQEVTWTVDNTDLATFDLDSFTYQSFASIWDLLFTGSNGNTFTHNVGGAETTTIDIVNANFNDITSFTLRMTELTGSNDMMDMDLQQLVIADLKAPASGPIVTSATYDASTNSLVVTGTDMTTGDTIDPTKLTLSGEGTNSYALTSASVTAASDTSFSITLNAADQTNVEGLLNQDGITAVTSGTTFNIAAATNWDSTAAALADLTDNTVTVSNTQIPTISSSTYDASTGILAVTGTNLVNASGGTNDITANKFTITGAGKTYTLTDSANVEITSATAFSLTLSATDKAAVNPIINKNGTSSNNTIAYNLAAADDWNTVIGAADISDTTATITASNVAAPTIISSTYDASTGSLVVTGTGFLEKDAAVDIIANKFTFTGEGAGGAAYTLTNSSNVEITNGTTFTIALSATDKAAINQIINKNSTVSTSGTTYNLAAAEDWAAGADAAVNVVDTTATITASNVAAPTITSSTYDVSTGALVVTGTGFLKKAGAADIVADKFTITGAGTTYTLTDSSDVEITNGTTFTITLSATDKAALNQIINKEGTSSTDTVAYNLNSAEDWAAGADAAVNVVDATGNGITASNVAVPAITSAAYDYNSNVLTVTGTNFLKNSGATNDVVVNKFTFTGEGGATYTLTSASNVEITSGTSFAITLSGADLTNVESLLNKDGSTADSGTLYNMDAAEDWAAGADAAVNVVDATGNGITVSNVAAPVITSATYDVATGQLAITGTNFVSMSGVTNDIVANLMTLTGEGGTYTLTDTANVESTSATTATLTLSATDQLNINGMLNKNGTAAGDTTPYNLAGADGWNQASPANEADLTGNAITVSNVATPTITSAVYDSDTGVVVVTGTNFVQKVGATNDVDLSMLTFMGGAGNATYTINTASQVEISSATSFTFTLSGADKTQVDALLDQIGTVSTGGSTYNLAGADNWLTGADAASNIADAAGNAVTVSIAPKITSATYNAATGSLVVTGTNILAKSGVTNDITANTITLTGEGGVTYTLTNTANVERTSTTSFTLALSATDKAAINEIVNKDGLTSTGGTTFNIAAADDWNAQVTAGDTSDTTGNAVTASNVAAPAITSTTYNASTGALVLTGTNLLKLAGVTNDIVANKFTFTGEAGATYTLTDTANVEITSGTAAMITLSAIDKAAVNQIVNKNGTTSTSGTTYNINAAEDWATGADVTVNVVDATGNAITASNVAVPSITSTTYNASTSTLVLTGTNFLKLTGATNDIVANKFTFTGEGGATYTLTDTANVEITSGTTATLTLSATDKTGVNAIVNKTGTSSTDATTYNLAAAEDWAAGADVAVNVVDATGNGITATIPVVSSGSGNSTPPPTTTTETVDGVTVETETVENANGTTTTTVTIEPVIANRDEDSNSANILLADIPLQYGDTEKSTAQTTVSLPVGVGLVSVGDNTPSSSSDALDQLIALTNTTVSESDDGKGSMLDGAQKFLDDIANGSDDLVVNSVLLTVAEGVTQVPQTIVITGTPADQNTGVREALVIDASNLPPGTQLNLNDVEFAVIIGPVTLRGGEGANIVYAGAGNQNIVLGADDDELHGGDGDDVVGSEGGDDKLFGEDGNDILFGGSGADLLHGGMNDDQVNFSGLAEDYIVSQEHGKIIVTSKVDPSDTNTLVNVESVLFDDTSFTPEYSEYHTTIATLYNQVFDRQADLGGFQYWAGQVSGGQSVGETAIHFNRSHEAASGAPAFDSLDNSAKIELFYQQFLGRDSDQGGKTYWLNELDSGMALDDVAEVFIETCVEIQGVRVEPEAWDFTL